jgi:glycogen phosphorylase
MPLSLPALPPRLSGLADVVGNLSWSWNRDARALFRDVDQQLWRRCRYDPIRLLREVSAERLTECSVDPTFLDRYDRVMEWFASEQTATETWFSKTYPALAGRIAAYFCAEFGLHHSVPIYSGGLGVLAGDHCKTASDLGVPLVGVGILYRAGYFNQRLRRDGWQEETDDRFDLDATPLTPLPGPDGGPCMTVVRLHGRDVRIRAWRLRAGRVPVYLLDSDLDDNHPDDRPLLSQLYPGGPELRIRQEWLLGVGGVRVLRALGVKPSAWHANEGHAAFMMVERLREELDSGASLAEATRRVRATTTFTTHTPVAAGHDAFGPDLLAQCIEETGEDASLTLESLMRLGLNPSSNHGAFDVTAAAIRLSGRVNAVSRAHQAVTRRIWAPLWPNRPDADTPIRYVTNGVHISTWMANPIIGLLDDHLGDDWGVHADEPELWDRVLSLNDAALWRVHRRLKLALLSLAREEARRTFSTRAGDADQVIGSGLLLDPDALTIGFARRFATYKRANLVFHDVERLLRILTDSARPVQIVFAGKAHPADVPGKQLLEEVYRTTRDPRFEGRIAFLENYDMHIAHVLVQGVDLWLNTPRVPLEASGTSGMKAALNGVPQLSTLDGWWAEGFDGRNGWAITTDAVEPDSDDAAARAAEQIYNLLEREIVPMYYYGNGDGLPTRWLPVMKHAICAAGRQFTSLRMVLEYVRDYYVPAMTGHALSDEPQD